MAYYKRIRELREDSDKTQREIAEYLGTPYQYYAVYEKGGSEISFERAIALAKYYGVSLDYIAELTDTKINPCMNKLSKTAKLEVINSSEEMLLSLFRELPKLSDNDKAQMREILKLFLGALK